MIYMYIDFSFNNTSKKAHRPIVFKKIILENPKQKFGLKNSKVRWVVLLCVNVFVGSMPSKIRNLTPSLINFKSLFPVAFSVSYMLLISLFLFSCVPFHFLFSLLFLFYVVFPVDISISCFLFWFPLFHSCSSF